MERKKINQIWESLKNKDNNKQLEFLKDSFKLHDYNPLRLSWFYVACFFVSFQLLLFNLKLPALFFIVVPSGVYYFYYWKYLKAERVFISKWQN